MRETIGDVFLGLAFLVILYNISLWMLSRRDGQFRSFVMLVPTILAVMAAAAGVRHWRLLVAVVALDLGLPFLRRRWPTA